MGKARRKEKDAAIPCQEEPKLYLESAVLECTVPVTRLRELVELPQGVDYNEWLASHTLAFFDHTNLIYGTISEFCTMSGCPDMSGPSSRQYLWFDEKGKKCKVAAPQYIDYVMTFTQKTVNDELIFPTKFDKEFPSSFESIVKKIHRLLFHVLAHIYYAHFKEIVLLNLHAHLNCLFSHFTHFNEHFKLIDDRETDVLQDLAITLHLFPQSDGEKTDGMKDLDSVPGDTRAETVPPGELTDSCSSWKSETEEKDTVREASKRPSSPPVVPPSPSSQSISSSISALHTRANSGGHSNSSSCAMDSAIFSGSSPIPQATASCGSSPVKFQ